MWVYRVSHCPTFSVNSLWIIGVCYRGMLVSVGQSHDISLWSILSLGNRSINVEMITNFESLISIDVSLHWWFMCKLWSGSWASSQVNSLWIIGVCYRGMLVSVGQSHDISLWSILSLGNRSINVEMITNFESLISIDVSLHWWFMCKLWSGSWASSQEDTIRLFNNEPPLV